MYNGRLFNCFVYALILMSLALFKPSLAIAAGGALGPDGLAVQASDYVSQPPLSVTGADPFLMIDLSVELTQQAEAYTDGAQTYANGTYCPGRLTGQITPWGTKELGICYSPSETYIGYFDPAKCYAYDTTAYSNSNTDQLATGPRSDAAPHFFKPVGLATNHKCSGQFSGNFLNWSTMTALDEFRSAMTGGARLIDTAGAGASTMLIRTRRFDDWGFVYKTINSGGVTKGSSTFTNNPMDVTPFTSSNFTAPTNTSSTSACYCSTSNSPSKCTKSGSTSQNPSSCSCSQTTATNYSASNDLLVVNNWSGLGAGQSLHKTRFYSYNRGSTTTTATTTYTRSGYTCPVVTSSTTSAIASTPTLLTVGGDSDINVIVKACDPSASAGGLESNCVKYTDGTNTWYKPEGLLQKNSLKMTYALDSYTGRSGNTGINGGVLRANAKYIGNQMPTSSGGIQDNPNKEVDVNGLFVFDPDKLAGKTGVNGVAPVNSGILNYINQFALFAGKYKSNDPDAELYYEGLRYIMHLGPTPSFSHPSTPLTASEQDGYPVFAGLNNSSYTDGSGSPAWSDPVKSSCQKNYALYVGDKNTWANDYIPNGYSLDSTNDPSCNTTTECDDAKGKGIDASALEDYIGSVEGTFSKSTNQGGRWAGYGTPALAWWANTHDVRTDIAGNQRVKTFMVDTQEYGSATPVGNTNELWLAAKWGGFEDSTGNNVVSATTALSATPQPDLTSEWNAKGAVFSDGTLLPDTYTLASQPANMVSGLTSAFSTVSSSTGSAAAAAVVANTSVGTATIYQSTFRPRISNNTTAITWAGTVRGFFVDDQGRFREDSDGDGKLTIADDVIVFRLDTTTNQTVVDRYTPGGSLIASGVSLNSLNTIWDASNELSALTDTQIVNQRAYSTTADNGRYIFTWIDTNGNGVVDPGELQDFTAANFPNINATNNNSTLDPARLLGLDSVTGSKSTALVNYIRGLDQAGYRSRTIDEGSGAQTHRLGDIVHSAALVVGAPSQTYDAATRTATTPGYGDNSYGAFKTRYANRRQVLYVGANDGMLHAFNGGFFGAAADGSPGYYTASNLGAGPETKHPLGSELWAYVPYDLLPHLQDLADTGYSHEYFVDGTPQQFDVNIFNDCANVATCDHPYGWGTILVVGFRFGGGDLTVNATTDQTSASDSGNRTLRSAYLIFDITNPEHAPTLLAELTQPTLGFTVSKPVVVKHRVADALGSYTSYANGSSSANQWYLVMGSGPAGTDAVSKQLALTQAVSNQQARMFVYDLNNSTWVDADTSSPAVDPFLIAGEDNSFVGDMSAADWNNDYTDDAIYFGTVGTAPAPNSDQIGDLMRMQMPTGYVFGAPTFSSLLTGNAQTPSNGQPFSSAPFLYWDNGQPWVYAGSGRFYVSSDIMSTKQMSFYGIKEPLTGSTLTYASVPKSSLLNTAGIQVLSDSSVKDASGNTLTLGASTITQYGDLQNYIANNTQGWYFNFNGTSERFVDNISSLYDTLVFVAYTPSGDTCSPAGSSRLFAVSETTGTASPFTYLGSALSTTTPSVVPISAVLGVGESFSSGAVEVGAPGHLTNEIISGDSGGGQTGTGVHHTSSGSGRRTSWRELPLE